MIVYIIYIFIVVQVQLSPFSSYDALHYGEPFQACEMGPIPHSEKPVGSEVAGQDPRPWVGFPLGNHASIVHRLL